MNKVLCRHVFNTSSGMFVFNMETEWIYVILDVYLYHAYCRAALEICACIDNSFVYTRINEQQAKCAITIEIPNPINKFNINFKRCHQQTLADNFVHFLYISRARLYIYIWDWVLVLVLEQDRTLDLLSSDTRFQFETCIFIHVVFVPFRLVSGIAFCIGFMTF